MSKSLYLLLGPIHMNNKRMNPAHEIYSERILKANLKDTYEAFSNPLILKRWWGPKGFTNTIHEFDLRPGGRWVLTMHGPEKGNYENESVFKVVEPMKRVEWTRLTQPYFDMIIGFEAIDEHNTRLSFLMRFESEETCNKIRRFAEPNNEENFDRLETLLRDIADNLIENEN